MTPRHLHVVALLMYLLLVALLAQSQVSLDRARSHLRNAWAREDQLHGMVTQLMAACRPGARP